jgi:ribonuclease R
MKKNWQDHDPDFAAEQAKHANPLPSRTFLLKWLGDSAGPMTVDEIGAGVGLPADESRQSLDKRLQAMVRDGQLVQNRRGAYGPLPRMHVVKGRVQGHRDGYGFLIREDGAGPDIFLNPRQMRELLPGDIALVRISGTDQRGRPEGVLVEVVQRTMQGIVGRYVLQQNVGYVIPDNPRITHDILIPPGLHGGAKAGQMVVAELTTPPGARTLPVGKVKEVLGDHLAPGMEIEAAIRAHGLPHEWPAAVEQEAAALPKTVSERDCAGRHDFRPLPLVTIDGEDARDFDDAVHAQRHKDGWKLWVAIADVAAYVKPGSALDQEGLLRGNSVYFPERVIPMLPEALSNGLCSLNPHVDRLCMVCELTIDADGEIQGSRFYEGVMHSQARLTYNQVFSALDDPQGPEAQRFASVLPHLQVLDELFQALFAARERRGAIDLESTETKVVFGPDRKIERIVPVTRNRAHRIIEECMIAANIEAARFVLKHERPAPHRVHAQPDVTKVQLLREFLAERGLVLGGGDKPKPKDYAKVLVRSRERPDYRLIQTVCLRSLMQARYSAEPTGHFGLALGEYAHFTSPIRRYPDLLLHRAIKSIVHKRKGAELGDAAAVEAQCAHCSTTERRADEATRDVLTWLKCEYMQHRLGESYVGTVTAAVSFGLFVELEGLYIEGLVHISSLKNDYYVHEASQHRLRGERTGRVYTLGQKLRVKVVRVNLDERKIDLEPVEGGPREAAPPRRDERSGKPSSGKADRGGGRGRDQGRGAGKPGGRGGRSGRGGGGGRGGKGR